MAIYMTQSSKVIISGTILGSKISYSAKIDLKDNENCINKGYIKELSINALKPLACMALYYAGEWYKKPSDDDKELVNYIINTIEYHAESLSRLELYYSIKETI